MKYKKIISKILEREGVMAEEVEEMKKALKAAGIECSVDEFIKKMSKDIKKRLYIV